MHLNKWRDDVIAKPSIACLHVGGKHEVGARCQRGALSLADAELGHSPDPGRNGVFAADLSHFESAVKAAHALNLEVGDAQAAELDRKPEPSDAVKAFVKANRRPNLPL